MIEEILNKDLMCDVYRHQAIALQERLRRAELEKKLVLKKLLKAKPELEGWVKLNFGENNAE